MTHVEKAYNLLRDGSWHCQKEFREFSWSPHKRRAEAEVKYKISIEDRPCEHGIKTRDYRASGIPPKITYRVMSREEVQAHYENQNNQRG